MPQNQTKKKLPSTLPQAGESMRLEHTRRAG